MTTINTPPPANSPAALEPYLYPLDESYSFDSFESQQIPWLWNDRFPLGQISLLVSHPGVGKSLLSLDIAARVSTGAPWPDESPLLAGEPAHPEQSRGAPRSPASDDAIPPSHKGSVLLCPREDDPYQVIRPRLIAHGATLKNVRILDACRDSAKSCSYPEMFFNLRHVAPLFRALDNLPDCKLLILDPIAAFFFDADCRHDGQVRTMLAPLFHLAQRHNLAVLILHHLQKRATRFADGSILGAGSFASVCRNVWHLIPDSADKDRRLLVPGKSNFARIAPALAFKVTTDEKTNAARIVWEDKPINIDADEALAKYACSKTGPDPICRVAAQNWLTDYLQNGPVDAQRIRTDACNAALAWRTVERAADYINIIRKRKSHNDWTWQLPANLLNIHCSAPGVARPEPSRREC